MTLDDIKGRCRIDGDCWLWTGALSAGWPRIWAPDHTLHGGKFASQHGRRAAWHIKTGEAIPAGHRVFGTCEHRNCLNPAHMVCRATAEQGQAVAATDRLKGVVNRIKANRASGRKRSHLTPDLIQTIHTSPETGQALAQRLGLSRSTVSKVRSGKPLAFDAVGGMFTGLLAANRIRGASKDVKVLI